MIGRTFFVRTDIAARPRPPRRPKPPLQGANPMTRFLTALALAAVAAAGLLAVPASHAQEKTPATAPAAGPALNFTMKDIDGNDVPLSKFAGKVILMVNVASKCGNTPQYEGLEKTYEKYKDKGFVILGFPANNFGGQEPGTNAEIKAFCEETYKVAFPMFSKISVKGDDMHPLYKYLTNLESKPLGKGNVAWNFEKFLIGRDGTVVGRFGNKTKPEDPTVVAAIDAALAK
jgi:glutathione peroxidase